MTNEVWPRCGHPRKDNVCNVSAHQPHGQCRECRRATDRRRARRNTPTRVSWLSMRKRCTYPAHPYFHNYGGRGIKVCDRWRRYKNFLADMGKRPPGMTLDRIDVNGNYEAGNCRWATASEQRRNQRAA